MITQRNVSSNKKLFNYLQQHSFNNDKAVCPRCGSARTVDDHFIKNMQVCHCSDCHYTFIGVFE